MCDSQRPLNGADSEPIEDEPMPLRDDLCPACGLSVEPGEMHPECARWP